ncbi:MAG: hypothetical protein FJ280_18810 [Planctomycetes bacterium]|nr:hypothetical protein [Planctomycetota bacterium]
MKNGMKIIAAVLLTAWIPHPMPAAAQSYTIDKPGELPVHVRTTPGGATISKSGELPAYTIADMQTDTQLRVAEVQMIQRLQATGLCALNKQGTHNGRGD